MIISNLARPLTQQFVHVEMLSFVANSSKCQDLVFLRLKIKSGIFPFAILLLK